MKILLAFYLSLSALSAFGKSEIDSDFLEGEWKCVHEFNLTDSVKFHASHTSQYSMSDGKVVSFGTITTSQIQSPDTKSILQVRFLSHFSIEGLTITFEPYEIEGTVLENGLGDLTEEFVRGFEQHKVKSSAEIQLVGESHLILNYDSGTSAECLRR